MINQLGLDLGHELVIDLFAGGGGASTGIEAGIGRPVDIAVNHDPQAVAMHQANHPRTRHFCESVFKVNPIDVTGNQPVGLLWASPDCTHHSKAKGGKPVSAKRRGLAWVVIRWARRCRPRAIMLENVEEFQDWGPLTEQGRPCAVRKGQTFRLWVAQLERLGYQVEHRELRACDYGTPTIRKRLFVIARRDGRPIVWPKPSHGPADSLPVRRGKLQPYRSAAECIDWSLPCPSIFERKKPLAENTMRRIARGIQRFVLETADPFIVKTNHTAPGYDQFRGQSIREPLQTVTATHGYGVVTPTLIAIDHGSARGGCAWNATDPLTTITTENRHAVVVPTLIQTGYGERPGQAPRVPGLHKPLGTVVAGGSKHALVAAFLAKHFGGNESPGWPLAKPISTVTAIDHHALVTAHMINMKGTARSARDSREPLSTICAGATHAGLVAAFMAPYYGSGSGETGRDLHQPSPTATTKDRLQLVTVSIEGSTYVITDIDMRMLQPRELFRANGFPDSYIIDPVVDGKPLPKYAQVRMCGNSVPPQWPEALVKANFVHESASKVAS